jgi:hypothetical protein
MRNTLKTYGRIYIFITLILLPFVIFIRAANYDFVWDDKELYINEKHLPESAPMSKITGSWLPKSNEMYAPVTYTVWGIAASLSSRLPNGGFSPSMFHIFNILIHIANCLLVFLILNKLLRDQWSAFAGALIFAVHPLQVESVAWISETRGLLAGFFGFLAIWLYVRHIRKLQGNSLPSGINRPEGRNKNHSAIEKPGDKQ